MLLEALWNTFVTITDNGDAEVILRQIVLFFLSAEAIVVVNDTLERRLQLLLVLVIHCDANSHRRWTATLLAPATDVRQVAISHLDVTWLAILSETGTAYFLVELRRSHHERLVCGLGTWLPGLLHNCAPSHSCHSCHARYLARIVVFIVIAGAKRWVFVLAAVHILHNHRWRPISWYAMEQGFSMIWLCYAQ